TARRYLLERGDRQVVDGLANPRRIVRLEQAQDGKPSVASEIRDLGGEGSRAGDVDARRAHLDARAVRSSAWSASAAAAAGASAARPSRAAPTAGSTTPPLPSPARSPPLSASALTR